MFQPERMPFLSVPASSGTSMNDTAQSATTSRQSMAGVRLRKHADYQRAYAAARKKQSSSMSWFLARRPDESSSPQGRSDDGPATGRVGLTAGKVLGKAHDRNRIKRRMRDVLRRHVDLLPPGCDLILHPRRNVLTLEYSKLEAEIVRILTQARTEAGRLGRVPVAAEPPARPVQPLS